MDQGTMNETREIPFRVVGSEVREKMIRVSTSGGEQVKAGVIVAKVLPFFGEGTPLAERDETGADENVSWHLTGIATDGSETGFGPNDVVDFNQFTALQLTPRIVAGS